jgi:hypothetical protein
MTSKQKLVHQAETKTFIGKLFANLLGSATPPLTHKEQPLPTNNAEVEGFAKRDGKLKGDASRVYHEPAFGKRSTYAAFHLSFARFAAAGAQEVCVLVANEAEGVGKSAISANMLYPNLCSPIVSVDPLRVGASGFNVWTACHGAHALNGQMQLLKTTRERPVVDIGSAIFPMFQRYCADHAKAIEMFDCIVVPVTRGTANESATIRTLEWFRSMKVDPARMRIVFNKVQTAEDVDHAFPLIRKYLTANPQYTNVSGHCVLPDAPAFAPHRFPYSVCETLFDATDYGAELAKARAGNADRDVLDELVCRHSLQMDVRDVAGHIDAAYRALNIPVRRACEFSPHVRSAPDIKTA